MIILSSNHSSYKYDIYQRDDGWQKDANCIEDTSPDRWFMPESYPSLKKICATCPVIDKCRDATDAAEINRYGEKALTRALIHGLFAGETPRERILRRKNEKQRAFGKV